MTAIHPLVTEHLRHDAQQAYLNVLGVALAVMMILTLAGTSPDRASPTNKLIVVVRLTVVAMAWLTTGSAVLYLMINRFSQVKERTLHFGILRVLGGSLSFILTLLLQETILIALPGAIIGILLAYLHGLLLSAMLGGLFVLRIPYSFWLPAGIIAAIGFFVPGLCAAWLSTRLDVLDALAYED